ncbi:MAG: methionine--tRNA ligase [Candidatus Woesearchaeota archaeon]|nr:methionine--tRNA ligase [Candidatus Woesearchaeota archaeon]
MEKSSHNRGKKYYVTTPIYYPNDIAHIGSAYTTIAADIIARWHRLDSYDTFFLTGLDEHGKKIEEAAEKNGMPPKEFVDEKAVQFKDAWNKLNIHCDRFIRTSDPDHEKNVQALTKKIDGKGDIYKAEYEGLYCTGCEAFYLEKDLVDGCCPIHNNPVEKITEESYFFRLSKYRDALLKLYKEHPDFILPKNRAPEIIARVKEDLKDLSVSRKNLKWGIPFATDKSHTTYVWFDALSNYLSGVNYYFDSSIKEGIDNSRFWPADCQLVGKDIIWFHCVIWPAMLMSLDVPLPKHVFVHGWWTVEGDKISKSKGNVVTIEQLIKYGVDSARYFLFRAMPFGADGDFSEKEFVRVLNSELADGLGNLITRTTALVRRFLGNNLPKSLPLNYQMDSDDKHLREFSEHTVEKCREYVENVEIDKALQEVWLLIKESNRYITVKEPWVLAKTDKNKLEGVLFNLVQSIRYIAYLISPYIPESSEKIIKLFHFKEKNLSDLSWECVNSGTVDEEPRLFAKIEFKEKEKFPACIKIAKVLSVEEHPSAEKLYVLKIDLGGEERTLVAGLRNRIPREEILGSKIVIVSNLKPKMLRGVESRGMLIAASEINPDGTEKISLLRPDGNPGEEIFCGDLENSKELLDIEDFAKIVLEVKDKSIFWSDKQLKPKNGTLSVDIADGAKIR